MTSNISIWNLKWRYCWLVFKHLPDKFGWGKKLTISNDYGSVELKADAGDNSTSNRRHLYFHKNTCKYQCESIIIYQESVLRFVKLRSLFLHKHLYCYKSYTTRKKIFSLNPDMRFNCIKQTHISKHRISYNFLLWTLWGVGWKERRPQQ